MNEQSNLTLRWPSSPLPAGAHDSLVGPGAPFELVEEKIAGVRMSVFARRPPNLREVLRSAADRFGARPYLIFPDRRFTFDSITDPVASAAGALQNQYGIRRGDRVAIAAANSSEHLIALWAIVSLGGIAVGLNGWWTGAEMSSRSASPNRGSSLVTSADLSGWRARIPMVPRFSRLKRTSAHSKAVVSSFTMW